jgi:hypothetical protein
MPAMGRPLLRNLSRVLLNALVALSLLAGVAAGVLWQRSRHAADGAEDRVGVYFPSRYARYTLRSWRGRLVLYAPPPPAPPSPPPAPKPATKPATKPAAPRLPPEHLAAAMANDQIAWRIWKRTAGSNIGSTQPGPGPRAADGTPAAVLATGYQSGDSRPPAYTHAELARHLLAALEDPNRFVAAHVGLWEVFGGGGGSFESGPGHCAQTVDGLRASLRPTGFLGGSGFSATFNELWACAAHVDPAQLPAVRDRWHRRLDVQVAAAPRWAVTGVLLLPPGLWIVTAGRRRRRARRWRRAGRCPYCGYDLRGNVSGICPECGAAAAAAGKGVKS